jgi:hypothetical protein
MTQRYTHVTPNHVKQAVEVLILGDEVTPEHQRQFPLETLPFESAPASPYLIDNTGGGGRIRTHGTRKGTTVFKTAAIDHSATPPQLLTDSFYPTVARIVASVLAHGLNFMFRSGVNILHGHDNGGVSHKFFEGG